ncbi:MAG TPA: glycosyltransferase family 2 protein [Nitrospiria bacterium]|jgi:dolichol-phosphate mannosyltransferase|nr:glycosyltransferase family 2 protein [Nitrospiria bacterium]
MTIPDRPLLSVVVPVYNEEAVLQEFYKRLHAVLTELRGLSGTEIIFVDDGSQDGTAKILSELMQGDKSVKVLQFSRNFGHEIALTAGLDHAKGDAVVVIDADLQDPPETIPRLLDKWRDGYEVVYGVRESRETDTWFKRTTARLFYALMQKIGNLDLPVDAGDFRLLDRKVVDVFRSLGERHRFVRGLTLWVGFRQTGVLFPRSKRFAGSTKYPFGKMLKLAWDGVTSFSFAPLRVAIYLGLIVSVVSFLFGLFVIFGRLFFNQTELLGFPIHGWGSLMVAVLFLAGVQLIVLGMMGEYLGRTYEEVKRRPLYILREKMGFDD